MKSWHVFLSLNNQPTKLTNEQKELLKKFNEIEDKKTSKQETFFDKLKKGFKK